MGQRLIISIRNEKDQTIANTYYHWAGFSKPAIEKTLKIIQYLEETEEPDPLLKSIFAFEHTGATLSTNQGSLEIANTIFSNVTFESGINRSNGLIEITKKGINENYKYGEAFVDIYLLDDGNIEVNYDVLSYLNDHDHLKEWLSWIEEDDLPTNIVKIDFDFYNMIPDDVYHFNQLLEEEPDLEYLTNEDGNYFVLIV